MSERWHFQIDGKRYGPVETADLERFLAPPRLCKFMEVHREGSGDDWISIGPKDDLNTALKRLGVELPPRPAESAEEPEVEETSKSAAKDAAPAVAEAAPQREWRPGPIALLRHWLAEGVDQLAEFIARFWIPFALAAVWGAINLGIYIYSNLDYASEREVLTAYVEVWNEYLKLHEEDAQTTPEQWEAFAATAKSRLQPLVDDLATRTDAQTPVRRHLLWAGRDCLIPVVSGAGSERQPRVEFGFQQHVNAVEQLLEGKSPKPLPGSPRT